MSENIYQECRKQADQYPYDKFPIAHRTYLEGLLTHCSHLPSNSDNSSLESSIEDSKSDMMDLTESA